MWLWGYEKYNIEHMKETVQDSLADEQQVYLSWVDQVYVGESIHSLQTRVDTTVQLQNTSITVFIHPG